MTIATANNWQRILGVSLRPWSGVSPLSLILRGAIHVAICVFFMVMIGRLAGGGIDGSLQELAYLRQLAVPVLVVLVVLAAIGALRVVIGVLDLVPRRHHTGVVVSLRERRLGDALPRFAQRMLFERNPQRLDQRRHRTEVVLQTESGTRQWTLRSYAKARALQEGAAVRLTVTPLAGYVANIEPLSH